TTADMVDGARASMEGETTEVSGVALVLDQTIVAQLVYHLFVDFPRTPDEQVSTRIVSMFSSPRLDRGLATRTWDAYGLETPSEERAVVAEGVWRETPHVVVRSNDEGTRFPDTTNLRLEPG